MKAVILAANPSRRLSPFIEKRAKPMLHIAGGLILENTLKALRQAGFREIMVVVNHEEASIHNALWDVKSMLIAIKYIENKNIAL